MTALTKLVVFDVDNTLTNTGEADTECFLDTVSKIYGFSKIDNDWSHYKTVTAVGIIDQIFRQHTARPPKRKDITRISENFLINLRQKAEKEPGRFSEIPGAAKMMNELLKTKEYAVTIATGSFRGTTLFKLGFAGIPFDPAVITTTDDCFTREELIDCAIQKAKDKYAVSNFGTIISVGDGLWDLKTAENLGLPFIGVGNKEKLQKAGARCWVPDYLDLEEFFGMLNNI